MRLLWSMCYLEVCCLICKDLGGLVNICYWFLDEWLVIWQHTLYAFSFFQICWSVFHVPVFGLFLWMFHLNLRSMCILSLLEEVFRSWIQLNWIIWCCLVQLCPSWFSACWISWLLVEGCWSLQLYKWIHLFLFVVLSVVACILPLLYTNTH